MSTPSKLKLCVATFSLCLAACGGGGGGDTTATVVVDLNLPSTYNLKWSDEFSTAGSPSSYWTYDLGAPLLGGTVWGNNEKQYYTNRAKNAFINSNGQLVIQPVNGLDASDMANGDSSSTPDVLSTIQSRGVSVTSARLTTNTSSSFSQSCVYSEFNVIPAPVFQL